MQHSNINTPARKQDGIVLHKINILCVPNCEAIFTRLSAGSGNIMSAIRVKVSLKVTEIAM